MRKGLLLFLLSLYSLCAFSQKCERIIICGFDYYVSPICSIDRYRFFPISVSPEDPDQIVITIKDSKEIQSLLSGIKKLKVYEPLLVDTKHILFEKSGIRYTIDIELLIDPIIKSINIAPREYKGFEVNQLNNQLCLILSYKDKWENDLIWVGYHYLDRGKNRYELNDEVIGLLSKYTNIWGKKELPQEFDE